MTHEEFEDGAIFQFYSPAAVRGRGKRKAPESPAEEPAPKKQQKTHELI